LEDTQGNSLVGMAEIIIAKHRNGSVGDVRLRFKAQFAKFCNPDEDIEPGAGSNILASRINREASFAGGPPVNSANPYENGEGGDNIMPF